MMVTVLCGTPATDAVPPETFGGGDFIWYCLSEGGRGCPDSSRHELRRRDLVVVVELGCI